MREILPFALVLALAPAAAFAQDPPPPDQQAQQQPTSQATAPPVVFVPYVVPFVVFVPVARNPCAPHAVLTPPPSPTQGMWANKPATGIFAGNPATGIFVPSEPSDSTMMTPGAARQVVTTCTPRAERRAR
jgi:hypothetical protein